MKFANFVLADKNYLPYLHVLINSLEMHGIHFPLYLMHYKIPNEYLERVQESVSFPIIDLEITDNDFSRFKVPNKNLFLKQARFDYIQKFGPQFDSICMFDADMFVATPNFKNLYELVNGTNKLIACNERYKWWFDQKYTVDGEKIFNNPVRAFKFHCSVPIIFDCKKWLDVFQFYNKLVKSGYEVDQKGNITKPIGDIFSWNVSVYKNNRQNDVILFPMETMTQVHYTYSFPWTRLIKEAGIWRTFAGDEVYSIHGRISSPNWYSGQINGFKKHCENHKFQPNLKQTEQTLKQVQKEWYNLAFNSKFSLKEFVNQEEFSFLIK